MRTVRKTSPLAVKLQAFVKDMADYKVQVGWFPTAKYPNGTPVAYIASIQVFGAPSRGIPARDFIRPTIAAKQGEWSQQLRYYASLIVKGQMDTRTALEGVAIVARGDIDKALATLRDPPLSKLTVYIRKFVKDGGVVDSYTKVAELREQMQKEEKEGTLDLSGVSDDPLEFSGLMRATLSYTVTKVSINL